MDSLNNLSDIPRFNPFCKMCKRDLITASLERFIFMIFIELQIKYASGGVEALISVYGWLDGKPPFYDLTIRCDWP